MERAHDEGMPREPVDPYTTYEVPAHATRAMRHAYVALFLGMSWLFGLEWFARQHDFAEDGLAEAAVRCLVPAALGLVGMVAARRYPIARFFPFLQGCAVMMMIAAILGASARETGGIRSPYIISLQTMLYLWGLIMPGGLRRALLPIAVAPAIFFGVLATGSSPVFADMRAVVAALFTAMSALLSIAYAEINERRRRAIWTASSVDSLSQLFNRRYLLERFAELHAAAQALRQPLSVLVVDIDEFKRINDTYGHAAGDVVIRGVARLLSESTRATDLSGRLGGEEFVLVLEGHDSDIAAAVGERIRASVEETSFPIAGAELRVTISVGVTTQAVGATRTIDDLLREADDALYASKRSGRNRVSIAPE